MTTKRIIQLDAMMNSQTIRYLKSELANFAIDLKIVLNNFEKILLLGLNLLNKY